MLYSYSFAGRKRDLADIFSTVVKDEPRFISNFKTVADASGQKHEWLEDQLSGRAVYAPASGGQLTLTAGDSAKLKEGTLLSLQGDPALFRVENVSGNTATLILAAANGSELTASGLPQTASSYLIVSTPIAEASVNGDGEEHYHLGKTQYNCTQIFRKEIVLSGTAMATNLYGSADNQINRQTAFALADLARDLNRVALFGRKVEADSTHRGEAGGLYSFAADNGLAFSAENAPISSTLINDAAQAIMAEGGEPAQILCSPGQARVLSCEYKDKLQILRSDQFRGAYVATVVNEINGRGLTIMADPDVPDTDVWVLDTAGFGLANLKGRSIADMDATPKGFDGIRRLALGELTFEFRNAAERCCRISKVQSSRAALEALR